MAKINVRSPYYVYYNLSNLESATLKLWIYTGTQTTSRPSNTNLCIKCKCGKLYSQF